MGLMSISPFRAQSRGSRKYPQVIESQLEHLQTSDRAGTTCVAEMDPPEDVPPFSWSIFGHFYGKIKDLLVYLY